MPLAYNPHAVCSKLSREQPPAALAGGARKSMIRCLSASCAAAHTHSTQPAGGLQRTEVLPTLPLAAELVQPPLASLPAECWNGAGWCEHGSFMRGHEASSSMKGCSPCMYLRCVRATRASARDICSTLPARRVDLRGFTRRFTRWYLPRSNALRVSHRTWMGACRRCVCMRPSGRHGRALAEAAVTGTRVQSAPRRREAPI